MEGYDPDATLRMRADNVMKKICQDFCQWLETLSGTDTTVDEEVLRDMFEIDFNAEACRAMQVKDRVSWKYWGLALGTVATVKLDFYCLSPRTILRVAVTSSFRCVYILRFLFALQTGIDPGDASGARGGSLNKKQPRREYARDDKESLDEGRQS